MIITGLKQAWQLLKQNKLFSTIYIVGTALAIASTTIFAIIYHARLAPVYPEYQKDRILTLSKIYYESPNRTVMAAVGVSNRAMEECFYNLKNAEVVSGYIDDFSLSPVFAEGRKSSFDIVKRLTDLNYFKVFNYEFLAGGPFTQEEFDAGSTKVVISDQVANKLGLSPDEAIGKSVNIGFVDYEICGVFREGSVITPLSYVQAIAPSTTSAYHAFSYPNCAIAGAYNVVMISDDQGAVRDEVEDYFRRFSSSEQDGRTIQSFGQPHTALQSALAVNPEFEVVITEVLKRNALILLTLLLVPALNLSGMIAGRMDSRMGELGIRKSFGATRSSLLSQVLWENLWLTFIGGVIGLVLTWLILSTDAATAFTSLLSTSNLLNDPSITIRFTSDMLFSPAIFGSTFIFCLLLNILSAVVPAYTALRRPIVKSLK